jgi:hypothetical protein
MTSSMAVIPELHSTMDPKRVIAVQMKLIHSCQHFRSHFPINIEWRINIMKLLATKLYMMRCKLNYVINVDLLAVWGGSLCLWQFGIWSPNLWEGNLTERSLMRSCWQFRSLRRTAARNANSVLSGKMNYTRREREKAVLLTIPD